MSTPDHSPTRAILEGDRIALARLLTLLEDESPAGQVVLDALFPHTGHAHIIGVTGATGTGKSTLVNRLGKCLREGAQGRPPQTLAVVAVDPTSPFSGGAVLGDRLRMRDLAADPGAFIRSMASRGSAGGLSRTCPAVVHALDAAGFEAIIVETVGAGQTEVDIARLAHTTLVVEAPGLGDEVQAIKAGILEIADILVVNKADRPGVEEAVRALQAMLSLAGTSGGTGRPEAWMVPVLPTVATTGEGLPDLVDMIHQHRQWLKESGTWQRSDGQRLQHELDALLQRDLLARWQERVPPGEYERTLRSLLARRTSPRQAAAALARMEVK